MDIKNLSYEEAVIELEQILNILENDECTLEESIKNFKLGISLHKYCSDLLTKTEGEIKILLENSNGELEERTFIGEVD